MFFDAKQVDGFAPPSLILSLTTTTVSLARFREDAVDVNDMVLVEGS